MRARTRRSGTAAVAALAAIGAGAAPASAATAPPTASSSFTPQLIGVGGTSSLSITISNPNGSGTLTGIAFTDALPSSLTVDDPNGESGSCGSSSVVTASPGAGTISLSGGSLKAGATCTISVAVTASQAEVIQNDSGPISSSAGTGGDSSAALTVLAPPTVTVARPKQHARYGFGQKVVVRYACGQSAYTLGISDCSASDDLGNDILSGGRLDTTVPGAHQLLVNAASIDGLVATDTVDYTVLPDNRFSISKLAVRKGALSFTLRLPGAGKAVVAELRGTTKLAQRTLTVHGKRALRVGLVRGTGTVVLVVAYTPNGGATRKLIRRRIKLG